MGLETLLLNAVGKARKATLNGRDYLVVPGTSIVPGILNGSRGRLYYPPDEINKDPSAWDGMPIVVEHPIVRGEHVSARRPDVLDRQGIGTIYGSTYNGRLRHEMWFDVQNTRRYDQENGSDIHGKLTRGEPMELSTGLFTDNEESPGTWNGEGYDAVARNYRPDHIAVLLNDRGACSLRDGCGVLVNAGTQGNPQSTATGRFKRHGSGTGKGDVHEAAQGGAMTLTDRNRQLGALARDEKAILGNNPASWVADEGIWEKAKEAAGKTYEEGDDAYWPAVAHIYEKMGGAVKSEGGTRNTTNSSSEVDDMATPKTREEKVKSLVANCSCWKGKERVLANKELFSDADLDALLVNAAASRLAREGTSIGGAVLVFNSEKGKMVLRNAKGKECDPDEDEAMDMMAENEGKNLDEADPDEFAAAMASMREDGTLKANEGDKDKKTRNQRQAMFPERKKEVTANEWLSSAPAEIRTAVRNAMRIEEREKQAVVARLVANIADDERREARGRGLMAKSLPELEEMLELLPTVNQGDRDDDRDHYPALRSPLYAGAVGGPGRYGLTENEASDVLDLDAERERWQREERRGRTRNRRADPADDDDGADGD